MALEERIAGMHDAITDVEGIRVGHAHDLSAPTGCTIVLVEKGATAGAWIGGTAAGTRQVEALTPLHLVECAHAVFLAGGSSFGLDAAAGVMRYLEEHGAGLQIFGSCVPIVPTAVIFDLSLNKKKRRPDAEMAYSACLTATGGPVPQGSVGAGAGATVGKFFGIQQAMKGGIGTASHQAGELVVGALVVTNPYGDVVDPLTGTILTGLRTSPDSLAMAHSARIIMERAADSKTAHHPLANTTLAVVATNAVLNKMQVIKVAQMANNGLARTISPFHTPYDGDVVFALATGKVKCPVNSVGTIAEAVVARATCHSVIHADGLGLLPAHRDLSGGIWKPAKNHQ